ncbi:hypothetical protein MMC29_005430, partial [Sticta canariensis]|nr:hypothetical protein [Sticta canariensis]
MTRSHPGQSNNPEELVIRPPSDSSPVHSRSVTRSTPPDDAMNLPEDVFMGSRTWDSGSSGGGGRRGGRVRWRHPRVPSLTESDSPSSSEVCGCAADVADGWLGDLETDSELGFTEALEWPGTGEAIHRVMHGEELATALDLIYERRNDPWGLKTQPDTYHDFLPARRPQRPPRSPGIIPLSSGTSPSTQWSPEISPKRSRKLRLQEARAQVDEQAAKIARLLAALTL